MKTVRLLLLVICASIAANLCTAQVNVRLVIQKKPASHSQERIYLAANFNNWSPGEEGYSFKTDTSGREQFGISLAPGHYEYKLTRGSWAKREGNGKGGDIENRSFDLRQKDTTINLVIASWRDDNPDSTTMVKHTASKNVRIIDTAFYIPQLKKKRRIWMYTPASYKAHPEKRYPVLYMHDGQNLFDAATSYSGEWGVDEYLDSAIRKGGKEVIVIGIDNGQSTRMKEYNPYEFAPYGKGQGDEYVDFLVKTLKPYIDAKYRTLPAKQNTFIAGSSMGGLISLYAVLKYPGVYGGAGIFSPAFWTAKGLDDYIRKKAAAVDSKLFFYAGGKEGETMLPDMLRVESLMKKLSKATLKELIDNEAAHNEAAWRKYFPVFYKWISTGLK